MFIDRILARHVRSPALAITNGPATLLALDLVVDRHHAACGHIGMALDACARHRRIDVSPPERANVVGAADEIMKRSRHDGTRHGRYVETFGGERG